jgi:hypothetical protein
MKPKCVLVGTDDNVFALAGRVNRALRGAGQHEAVKEFNERLWKCKSYDEALQLMAEYVEIE